MKKISVFLYFVLFFQLSNKDIMQKIGQVKHYDNYVINAETVQSLLIKEIYSLRGEIKE